MKRKRLTNTNEYKKHTQTHTSSDTHQPNTHNQTSNYKKKHAETHTQTKSNILITNTYLIIEGCTCKNNMFIKT